MTDIGERKFQVSLQPFSRKHETVITLKFLDWTGASSELKTTGQGVETKKRKGKKNFTGIQGDGFQIGGGAYLRVRLIHGRLRYIIGQGSFPEKRNLFFFLKDMRFLVCET